MEHLITTKTAQQLNLIISSWNKNTVPDQQTPPWNVLLKRFAQCIWPQLHQSFLVKFRFDQTPKIH